MTTFSMLLKLISLNCILLKSFALSPYYIKTLAGRNNSAGFTADNVQATSSKLNYPSGVWATTMNNIYVADQSNCRIRRVGSDGIITTVIGSGEIGTSVDNKRATSAAILFPTGIWRSPGNLMYFGESAGNSWSPIYELMLISDHSQRTKLEKWIGPQQTTS